MSDWTQNPFASADSDPFNDPSVKAAGVGKVPEYNPFEGSATQEPSAMATKDVVSAGAASFGAKSSAKAAPAPAPAPVAAPEPSPHEEPAWAKPKGAAAKAAPAPAAAAAPKAVAKAAEKAKDVDSAEEALRRKEYEQREQQVRKDPNNRPANFPPFPAKCPTPFKPCYHHDFKGELPAYGYKLALESYYLWIFTSVAYFWNFICSLSNLASNGTGQSAGISCAFMVIGAPCAYCCWFQHLYTAFRLDSSLRYGFWFFVTAMQMIFAAFLAVGFPSTGAAGFWVATAAVTDNKVVGIMLFTSAILWSINVLWSLWVMKRVLSIYRSTGQSSDRAKGELSAAGGKALYSAAATEAGQNAIRGAAAQAWSNNAEEHA